MTKTIVDTISESPEPAEVKPDATRKVAVVGEIPFSGSALARAIADVGMIARVLCPDARSSDAVTKALPNHAPVEIVEGEIGNATALASAMEGVYGACFVSPVGVNGRIYRADEHVEDAKAFILAAETAALRRMVYHSAVGASVGANSRALQDAAIVEELLGNSRCEDFRIRTGPLMGANDGFMAEIVAQARKPGPFMTVLGYGSTVVQPLAAADFGRCMAELFSPRTDAMRNGVYAFVGPETTSLLELTDSALELLKRNKVKFHAPLFVLKPLSGIVSSKRFRERVGLLFDAFAVEQSDVPKLLGKNVKLIAPIEVQKALLRA